MNGPKKLVALSVAMLGAIAPAASPAQPAAKDKALSIPKAEMFASRFHATGQLQVVELRPKPDQAIAKVIRNFGAGAFAEKQAYALAATFAGGAAPVVVRRVLKHYRCPRKLTDPGDSTLGCDPVKITYVSLPTPPALLRKPNAASASTPT